MDKIAVLDLDDTLINLKQQMLEVMMKYFPDNKVPHWSLWEQFNVETIANISDDALIEVSNSDKIFRKAKPHLFSPYILRDLHQKGFYVVILTSREGFVKNAYEETEAYLKENDLYHDELIVSGHGKNKVDYLQKFDRIDFTIDDQVKNCINFQESGKVDHVFLHALPWNKSCNTFKRIHNLYQVYPYLGLT
jgi:hypothetical protein